MLITNVFFISHQNIAVLSMNLQFATIFRSFIYLYCRLQKLIISWLTNLGMLLKEVQPFLVTLIMIHSLLLTFLIIIHRLLVTLITFKLLIDNNI